MMCWKLCPHQLISMYSDSKLGYRFSFPLSFSEDFKCLNSGDKFADSTNVLDMRLRTILENVRLSYLLEREEGGWDANLNWEDTLSLGEQQRLGMVSKSIVFKSCLSRKFSSLFQGIPCYSCLT